MNSLENYAKHVGILHACNIKTYFLESCIKTMTHVFVSERYLVNVRKEANNK